MEQILNKIKNNYSNEPYPHMTIDDFLPQELLLNINKEWNGEYIKRLFEHSAFKNEDKEILISTSTHNKWLSLINNSNTFKKIDNIFSNINIYHLLCNVFKNDIKEHIKDDIDITKIIPDIKYFLLKANPSYKCRIHIDNPSHIFSIIMYPDLIDNNNSELSIYEMKNKNVDKYDIYPDEKDFILRKNLKSSNNNAIVFFNSPNAYHSVKPYKCKDEKIQRHYIYVTYTFNKSIWKKPREIFSQERHRNFYK